MSRCNICHSDEVAVLDTVDPLGEWNWKSLNGKNYKQIPVTCSNCGHKSLRGVFC